MKTKSLNIGKLIYEQCKEMGIDAYPCMADKGATRPFLIYRRSGLTQSESKDANYVDRINVEIIIASKTYDESVKLIQEVKDNIERKRYTYDGMCIEKTEVTGCSEYWSNDDYVQVLNFVFHVTAW